MKRKKIMLIIRKRKEQGRYAYKLSHGNQKHAKVTNIVIGCHVIGDDDDPRIENIGVSIFWLIYELVSVLCRWTPADAATLKQAFDKILGLALSMHL